MKAASRLLGWLLARKVAGSIIIHCFGLTRFNVKENDLYVLENMPIYFIAASLLRRLIPLSTLNVKVAAS